MEFNFFLLLNSANSANLEVAKKGDYFLSTQRMTVKGLIL